ncbi:bifunctional [glutamine synthetase] adenylyltransferase/[glutamine synthetase]-adenylyl-L-tyrosine phosphorylase [Granulicoccus phenolivorans]|uniref:bifunctional [glutamine synthetase] adenylyltransferase/[glutamine synthetase]-adenylyl-L-tyrosine phosphorylase n=1 Tax=Granulicoccus phenolivorans TaxID=266854 RepID=UPI00041F0B04|nr:bifunctional [glutamine synthetase] adenylyltransferase/[glutamine synthetase]-adenylyl-L-tyrosine phosphorylase [Granulicoccus phenolivorans]
MPRSRSPVAELARRGYQRPDAAVRALAKWGPAEELTEVVRVIAQAADPDLAMEGLDRIIEARPELLDRLGEDTWIRQLTAVMGASTALQQFLVSHPGRADVLAEPAVRRSAAELRARLLTAAGADPARAYPVTENGQADDLRLAYRTELCRVAARDLTHARPTEVVEDIAAELSDLADAAIEASLALAREQVGPAAAQARLAVIALGKCGAQELNYVSDVDVLYLAEPVLGADGEPVISSDQAIAIATKVASAMTRICSAHTAAGTIWQVDAALRPEGKAGPLVRTLASHRKYYQKWAKGWEFQAMLKARPMAGDLALGQDFVDMVAPMVWTVGDQESFVSDVQAMRKRVIDHIPAKEADRELKLSRGGLRDVEFSVQLLELVHGRVDERLRERATLPGLRNLIAYGYVGPEEGKEFDAAYRFTRVLEHRVQMFHLRRTHLLPDRDDELRRIARSVGLGSASAVQQGWRRHSRRVYQLHNRVFYSPLLEAVARVPTSEARLTTDAARDRLRALGYADPKAALEHIKALSTGLTRQADIQRQLLPAMLGWFAEGPNPDFGLLSFRQISASLGSTHWYLRALRDEGAMAQRLATILSSSRYLVDLLKRAPETMQLLTDTDALHPKSSVQLVAEMRTASRVKNTLEDQVLAIRAIRRRELFRIGAGDLLGELDLATVGESLTQVTQATLDATLQVVTVHEREVRGDLIPPTVIAMGRWGGRELSYSSDADALFVLAEGGDAEIRDATAVIKTLRSVLSRPGPEPGLDLDADLRPEGKGGPMVRTLASYRTYYRRWSATWEAQALVRADYGVGDHLLAADLLASVDALRWPEGGLSAKQLKEIRRLKARMEAERLPRGGSRKDNLKLGPGGLSDVEWTIQVLQMQHAHEHPELRTTQTLPALRAAEGLGLISTEDADQLAEVWTMASELRNRITLVRNKVSDSFPTDARELSAVALLMGYGKGESSHLHADYQRKARHARGVVDRLFWGEE